MVNISKLIKQLTSEDPARREEAILALGDLRDERAVEPLIKVVNQDSIENRTYSITALAEIGDHRAIETLVFCLMDNIKNIRLAAARSLGKFTSPQAISALLVSMRKDPDVTVKSRAALSLGGIGSELAVEDLLAESKLEHPAPLLYSIDSALKMIAKNNGYETVDQLAHAMVEKKVKHEEATPESQQLLEKEELLRFPNLWPYIRKYVFQQLEGIQTLLSIESDEKNAEKKIAEILGDNFWRFTEFMARKTAIKFSEYQSDMLWQMCWDTSKPIRSEIFQMMKDHRKEVIEIDKYQEWLDIIEEEKEREEVISGEAVLDIKPTPKAPPTQKEVSEVTAAELARSISGDIENIMKKYSRWKDDVEEQDEFEDF
ncbi:MAG: HEAT repeat domain-containing protein [Candidatus Heimdallarchaeota archaeon]|nr:HEAT repeat domain-containing protein [Candidatus Heimdallarchaeota archaeon]MCK4878591.1 HEAT repeat domain-containing protein [Candidatus Heimdallarchaeota archaeon]